MPGTWNFSTIDINFMTKPAKKETVEDLYTKEVPKGLTEKDLLALHRFMKMQRLFEERVIKLYRQGRSVGAVYTGIGHEGTCVGAAYTLQKGDVLSPMHRDLGAHFVRGITIERVALQYYGRKDGPTRGRDGNMHFGDIHMRIFAMVSMLADNMPVAAGAALAFKIRKEKNISLAFIGDGTTSRGDFHEALNFASVQKLGVIYVCENNQYAYSTPLVKQMNIKDIAIRAASYGIPGVIVDGNDVLAVYKVTKEAADRARAGEGPTLIECKTMRVRGHSEHDDASYVPRELIEEWLKKDPVARFEKFLLEKGVLSQAGLKRVADQINDEIDRAIENAEQAPLPEGPEVLEGVFAD